jgi:dTDP-4-dehydrorhamnose reductase
MARILVTGASGQLGGYLLRELRRRDASVIAWSGHHGGTLFGYELRPVDLAQPEAVAAAFRQARPEVVIHAGALARVDVCHREPERAWQVNVQGTATLAELAAEAGARLLFLSTDMVFDGDRGGYHEDDPPVPLSTYGRSKAAAEPAVLATGRGLVARVSLFFGPSLVGRPSFFDEQMSALRQGRRLSLFADEWRTPLSILTAARALVALADSETTGLLHLGGPERLSRLEMGQRLAKHLGADPTVIRPARREEFPAPEPRPRDVSLDSSRWRGLFPAQPWPGWEEALRELLSPEQDRL